MHCSELKTPAERRGAFRRLVLEPAMRSPAAKNQTSSAVSKTNLVTGTLPAQARDMLSLCHHWAVPDDGRPRSDSCEHLQNIAGMNAINGSGQSDRTFDGKNSEYVRPILTHNMQQEENQETTASESLTCLLAKLVYPWCRILRL